MSAVLNTPALHVYLVNSSRPPHHHLALPVCIVSSYAVHATRYQSHLHGQDYIHALQSLTRGHVLADCYGAWHASTLSLADMC